MMKQSLTYRLSCAVVILILVVPCSGQAINYNTEREIWYKGLLFLKDGRKFEGQLSYIFINDRVRLKNSQGQMKTMVANNVTNFVLFDSLSERRFYSLPYDVENSGRKVAVFFEEVYRNEQYAVMSRHIIEPDPSEGNFPLTPLYPFISSTAVPEETALPILDETVLQVIYLVDKNGKIMEVMEGEKSREVTAYFTFFDFQRPKYLDDEDKLSESATSKEVKKYKRPRREGAYSHPSLRARQKVDFKGFFEEDYPLFKKYVERERLDPLVLQDLIRAIDFNKSNG